LVIQISANIHCVSKGREGPCIPLGFRKCSTDVGQRDRLVVGLWRVRFTADSYVFPVEGQGFIDAPLLVVNVRHVAARCARDPSAIRIVADLDGKLIGGERVFELTHHSESGTVVVHHARCVVSVLRVGDKGGAHNRDIVKLFEPVPL
jgi:hypothetical protein